MANKGEGWSGAGVGAIKGLGLDLAYPLHRIAYKASGGSHLLGGAAAVGGIYGGHKLSDYLIEKYVGRKRLNEIFGEK